MSGGAQHRRVGASGLQNAPAVWHWKGAAATQGPKFVQTPWVPQQPSQQFVDPVQAPPSGVQTPPSRFVGWHVPGALPPFEHESPGQHAAPVMQLEP